MFRRQPKESTNLLISRDDLVGELANWAVQQSPYPVPEGLAEGLIQFTAAWPHSERFQRIASQRALYVLVRKMIDQSPQIVAWNSPKIDTGASFVVYTRYDRPEPDHDSIDLSALAGNVSRSVWRDAVDLETFNNDFQKRYSTAPHRVALRWLKHRFNPHSRKRAVQDIPAPSGEQLAV